MATSEHLVPETTNQDSENQVPEWLLASRGIKLILNNNSEAAQSLFLQYPNSLVMYSGYSFTVFMEALMTFEDDKLILANATLKEVERRCTVENGWLKSITRVFGTASEQKPQKSLADQLETQIILADSQVCLAILTFLQQDISGYFKGSWTLRKAWKVYQKTYKEILALYNDMVGQLLLPDPSQLSLGHAVDDHDEPNCEWEVPESTVNGYTNNKSQIPHSHSANLHQQSNGSTSFNTHNNLSNPNKNFSFLKKSTSINSALSSASTWSSKFNPFNNTSSFSYLTNSIQNLSSQNTLLCHNIDKDTITRLMGAICFGYGLFQLGISLLPPSIMRVINMLGFGANRQNGIACLKYARLGNDMRAPLATLTLLWYHTIVRPFYAIDGSNVQAGVDASSLLLQESEREFSGSALFLFFKGRVYRLNSDIPSALKAFQHSVENAKQREIKILSLHEVAWCHLIDLDYSNTVSTLQCLMTASRWSRAFYCFLTAICAGSCGNLTNAALFDNFKTSVESIPKGNQLDEFLIRRSKLCPPDFTTITQLKNIYWKMFVFEMLYLWNALPSCSGNSIQTIIQECEEVRCKSDEPMLGVSKFIAGSCHCILRDTAEGVRNFRKCLEIRKSIAPNAEDAHVSAFAQFELGAILIKAAETKEEGKLLLQQMSQYTHYDFEQRLHLRVISLLKSL